LKQFCQIQGRLFKAHRVNAEQYTPVRVEWWSVYSTPVYQGI